MRLIIIGCLTTIMATLALAELDVRGREHKHADRHRRPRLHDHDEQEDRERRDARDHDPRPRVDPRLPPDRAGVNKKTSISGTGTTKWTVKLKKGTYHFVCDPHHTIMHGVLKVT